MLKKVLAFSAAGAAAILMTTAARAQARVEVGVLTCKVRGGTGYIVGSTKDLRCNLHKPGRNESYRGVISKFGIDIGSTQQSVIAWGVFAPTVHLPPGSLNGSYSGISA